jgi:signal transduction histidine kinase
MLNLHDFLVNNKEEILFMTETKSLALAGPLPSSVQLKQGLPVFFQQLLSILRLERPAFTIPAADGPAAAKAAQASDEPGIAKAAGKPEEEKVAKSASLHGIEMLRLGYSLSHVVHAYGSMCQSITELAAKKDVPISNEAFHDLNQCLDVAIAGAVTEFQDLRNTQEKEREVQHLGFLAHELRNLVASASIAYQLIKSGTVGLAGNTGVVLEKSLKKMEELIDRSLTEVRLSVEPELDVETASLLMIVDQILVTARSEAQGKNQKIATNIDPSLKIRVDQQTFHSALSNLIQNAIKFTRTGGRIEVRGKVAGENVIVEVEDECGGLNTDTTEILFKAFAQKNENRDGLGLGLTIAQRAIELNHGTLQVQNLPGKGCVFRISLPNTN